MQNKPYIFFNEDYLDFWKLLNIEKFSKKDIVDNAYKEKINQEINDIEKQKYFVGWKLLRDKIYEKLYINTKSLKEVYNAGFFLDTLSLEDYQKEIDFSFISTPIHKIKNKTNKKKIVLISTGGFSPVHDGHIHKMELAKKEIEKEGYEVIGGYLSPSHDYYVSQKDNGNANNHILNRIRLCNEKTFNSNWLMVSPLEGIYRKTAINFTDVIKDLKKYLNQHLDYDFSIGYVFGGDNINFIKAFSDNDIAICISRKHKNEDNINSINLKEYNYIYIKDNKFSNLSSTAIRNTKKEKTVINNNSNNYLIRDDFHFSGISNEFSPLKEFKSIFQKYLPHLNFISLNVSKQLKDAEKDINKEENDIISLDVFYKNKYNVNLSREFYISDSQIRSNKLCNRPENKDFYDTINNIPKGNYTLVEDDIISGTTFNFLKEKLGKNKKITNCILLSNYGSKEKTDNIFDIVDLRDFFINMPYSGLVVNYKKQNFRVPYWFPYVDLKSRANINNIDVINFSLEIINLNIKFYNKLKKAKIHIKLNCQTNKILNILNLNKENNNIDTILKICNFHYKKLQDIKKCIQ